MLNLYDNIQQIQCLSYFRYQNQSTINHRKYQSIYNQILCDLKIMKLDQNLDPKMMQK